MNYENMRDFEINSKVAMHLGHSVSSEHECIKTGACFILTSFAGIRINFDPCNNPSDAWPILLSLIDNGCTIVIENNSFNGSDLNGKSITRKIAELYLGFNSN